MPLRLLMIHNDYGAQSGEEVEFEHIRELLQARGHEVCTYRRSSAELERMPLGKMRAFFAGIHNPFSKGAVRSAISDFRPDLAFVQNLFPLISPSILSACRRAGVPVVMRVANYRLMCPNGLHLSHGKVCERCLGGREYWCALKNCEGSMSKSVGYALRSAAARITGAYRNNITAYICASHFLRDRLIDGGFAPQRIHVVPNLVPEVPHPSADTAKSPGDYVAYVGRLSREKGVPVILEAARRCPHVQFLLAGRHNPQMSLPDPLPRNVQLVGFLSGDALARFYRGARIVVSASECFETFGLSVAEAMLHHRPVVVSRIGVFPEFIEDGVNGLLFEPGNAEDLANKITYLWERPDAGAQMGAAGRKRAAREYSAEKYYQRLMAVYHKAIELGPGGPRPAATWSQRRPLNVLPSTSLNVLQQSPNHFE